MIKGSEFNRKYAEKLSKLMREHPDLEVIVWVNTEDIVEDYTYYAGNLREPCIETIVIGKDGAYHNKEDDPYEDCLNYYGYEADDWTDEELEEQAKAIPWEDVIAVKVGLI